jgi:hypothetical protein
MLKFALGFLAITAVAALIWARHRRRDDPGSLPGLTLTKRFVGGWTVLIVGGFVAIAIFVIVIVVKTANVIGSLPSALNGCVNC